ncbi:MAG: ABC transporter substrate binding protein [Granulosicoccaceae bacterium]|jgi:ABC-type uncharacterized transport system substrate-binding protein
MLTVLAQRISGSARRYFGAVLVLCLLQGLALQMVVAETRQSVSIHTLNSHKGGYYERFVNAFDQAIRKHATQENIDIRLDNSLVESNFTANNSTDVYVTVGAKAAIALLKSGNQKPAIYTLLPEQTFNQIQQWRQPENAWHDVVFIDYPATLFLNLIKHAVPDKQKVGIILGPDSKHHAPALLKEADKLGLELAIEHIQNEDEVITALHALQGRMQVFLALPDKHVHNRRTAKTILLSTYRYNIPVVAYSQAYVKAGALTGMYATPDDMAEQAARKLAGHLTNDPALIACSKQPHTLAIDINNSVARLLARNIPNASELEQQMQKYLPECRP